MSVPSRRLLAGGLGAPLLLRPGFAAAQSRYPERPVQVIVPYAPGGGTDIVARLVCQSLASRFRRPFVVNNRPGAATIIGTDAVARARADGYTLLFTSVPFVVNPALQLSLPYTEGAFRPVTMVTSTPTVLVVHPSVPASNSPELVQWLRQNPGAINYASFGPGSGAHLAAVLFEEAANVRLFHVAYSGGGPALTAVVGGEVQMLFSSVLPVLPSIRAGNVRAIGVASQRRAASLPDVPTFREAGLDYTANTWFGLFAPAGTPDDVVSLLYSSVRDALEDTAVRRQLESEDQEIVASSPDDFSRYVATEIQRWRAVIRADGLRLE